MPPRRQPSPEFERPPRPDWLNHSPSRSACQPASMGLDQGSPSGTHAVGASGQGHPELMLASILERQPRAGDEVLHGPRDEDLRRAKRWMRLELRSKPSSRDCCRPPLIPRCARPTGSRCRARGCDRPLRARTRSLAPSKVAEKPSPSAMLTSPLGSSRTSEISVTLVLSVAEQWGGGAASAGRR
jgi:hypothetical protein